MHDHDPNELTRIERIAAFFTRTDHELLADDHPAERHRVVHEFVMLVAMYVVFVTIWTVVLTMFGLRWLAALFVAGLIEAIVILFDVAMAATDIHPRGILQHGALPRSFYWRIGSRLAVSLLLNTGTAVGVDLFMMRDEALKVMAREVDIKNAPIRREYQDKIDALHKQELEPIENRLADLNKRENDVADAEATARADADDALNDAQKARLEEHRQDDGYPGDVAGHGVLARDAEEQAQLAQQRMKMKKGAAADLSTESDTIAAQIKATNDQLNTATTQFNGAKAALIKERDARLLPVTDGPMTIVLGWFKLQKDPEVGLAVHLTTLIAWIVVTTLELAFFLSRVVFKGEQMHDIRLGYRMRRDAVDLGADLTDHVRAHRQRRPRLRVVADNEPQPPGEGPHDDPHANDGRG